MGSLSSRDRLTLKTPRLFSKLLEHMEDSITPKLKAKHLSVDYIRTVILPAVFLGSAVYIDEPYDSFLKLIKNEYKPLHEKIFIKDSRTIASADISFEPRLFFRNGFKHQLKEINCRRNPSEYISVALVKRYIGKTIFNYSWVLLLLIAMNFGRAEIFLQTSLLKSKYNNKFVYSINEGVAIKDLAKGGRIKVLQLALLLLAYFRTVVEVRQTTGRYFLSTRVLWLANNLPLKLYISIQFKFATCNL